MSSQDPEAISAGLSWKQFEELAEIAFQNLGYNTKRNFRMKTPRAEIDLLATRECTAFAVDCKHWKRTVGNSSMTRIGNKQVERCKNYLRASETQLVVPMILTWKDEQLQVLKSGVPVVPISKISDFVLNWESSPIPIKRMKKRERRKSSAASKMQKILFSYSNGK
jgi:Holliday junction resolvase-like predicted endonuclease